ncbi:MAG TPA: malectin, partial [Bacteroidales bacterium]|nr:malectin [Bacteroidales bacterium]
MKKHFTFFKLNWIRSLLFVSAFVFGLFSSNLSFALGLPDSIAINCGGNAYTAVDGTEFIADNYYTGGGTYSANEVILGTEDDVLYNSERNGEFSYNIPVRNGKYNVTLMIAEIYHTDANKRVFNVILEGNKVLSDFDPAALAGKDVPIDTTFTVTVYDGEINISTENITDNAKLSAIRIEKNQNVVWREDFSLPDGTTVNSGETAWTAVRGSGILEVADSMLIINDAGDVGVFTTGDIDISSAPAIVSLDVATVSGIDVG